MKVRSEIRAGLFLLVGLACFLALIFTLGSERQLFAVQREYVAHFNDVLGLSPGAPVRMGGITIGRVKDVAFLEDPSTTGVKVTLLVNEQFTSRLSKYAVVSIETQGLLGDRFLTIELPPGEPFEPAPPGSLLSARQPADIGQVAGKLATVADNAAAITDQVRVFLSGFDPQSKDNLGSVIESTAKLLRAATEGQGTLHRLLFSESDAESLVGGAAATMENLRKVSKEIVEGDGVLHALVFDEGGEEAVTDFRTAAVHVGALAEGLQEVVRAVREEKGLLHDLVYGGEDAALGDALRNLALIVQNLERVSDAIARGNGTLGALLIDPTLYDNLIEVTDEAKRSFVLRQLIRSSMNR